MMLPFRAGALLVVALLAGSSCSSAAKPSGEDSSFPDPLPYVISIALPRDKATSEEHLPVATRRLEESLRELSVCTALHVLQSPASDRKSAVEEARRKDADLLLRIVSTEQPTYRFSHRKWWYLPNTLLWFLAGFPSFWVKDRVYEVSWRTSFEVFCVKADRAVPRDFRFPLREEHALSVSDQEWGVEALYTPPAWYDTPAAGETLALVAESWLVDTIVEFLRREFANPGFPSDVEIRVSSPPNGRSVPGTPVLRYSITSPTELSRLRVELDGEVLEIDGHAGEWDSVTMVDSNASEGKHGYEHRLTLLGLDPGEHRLRVLALRTGEVRVGGEKVAWSTSQTVRFRVEAQRGASERLPPTR